MGVVQADSLTNLSGVISAISSICQHLSAALMYASTTELTYGPSNGCIILSHVYTAVYMHELLRLLFGFCFLSMFFMNPT